MTAAFQTIRGRLDQAGVLISGLCAVHCLLSIIIVGVLGLGGQVLLSPWIHRVGLAAAIGIGLLTLAIGAVRHARYDNLRLGAVGLGLMGGALTVDHGVVEAGLTVCGVALVALAHIRNLRARA
jgi:hypothetical protein